MDKFQSEASDEIRMRLLSSFFSSKGWFPTVREICTMFGWKSTNAAQRFLKRCTDRGWLKRNGRHHVLPTL